MKVQESNITAIRETSLVTIPTLMPTNSQPFNCISFPLNKILKPTLEHECFLFQHQIEYDYNYPLTSY